MNPEVLIIGGGLIGLSIARELRKRGAAKVTILDRGRVGSEASWAAAGMLAPNIEAEATDDFHRFGVEALKIYPTFAAELADETGIDIELDQSGTLYLAFDDPEVKALGDAQQWYASRGIIVDRLSPAEIRDIEPAISHEASAALLFPDDGQVENRKLVAALTRFARSNDVTIVEETEIKSLITDGSRVAGALTAGSEFRADVTVIATGAWTSLIKIGDTPMPFQVKPIRGQMAMFTTPERKVKRVVYSHRGYLVPRLDGRVLIGATVEDVGFEKSTTPEGIDELTNAAYEIAPELREFPVSEMWSGLRPFAADGLPVLGELPGYENAIVATAHYRNGILLAPLTGRIVAEKIIDGIGSRYFESFGAERFSANANAIAT